MKKVLIITYYWPPSGGPGVQRVLKFAKYLPQYGWQPIILTVKNGEYPAIDHSLEAEIPKECIVYKTKSLEPTGLYKKFTGMKKDEKIPVAVLADKNVSWKKKIANWIRINLFIPDAKIGWIPFAVKTGKQIIKAHKPEIIFSSSPPHSLQIIAHKLAKWSGIKWVADFRDPWTDIYHYDTVGKSNFIRKVDEQKERKTIAGADVITSVSKNVLKLLESKISVRKSFVPIANGYDEDDFEEFKSLKSDKFILAYGGKINNQQNPQILWKVLSKICNEHKDFNTDLKIMLIGNIAQEVIRDIEINGLSDNFEIFGYMEHNKLIEKLQIATVLLLLIPNTEKNKGILTGKLFEYLAMKKYILGFGPEDGDSAEILSETKSGDMVNFENEAMVKTIILQKYNDWKTGKELLSDEKKIQQYSRANLTQQLIKLFDL